MITGLRYLIFSFCICLNSFAQITNYVTNGSFEQFYTCNSFNIQQAKGWRTIDSNYTTAIYFNSCPGIGNVPTNSFGYQYPWRGDAYCGIITYCIGGTCSNNFNRTYVRNRLKSTLIQGVSYCVKMRVNILNNSQVGIDRIGVFFGDASLDTITKTNVPLTYLNPQIENPINNVIVDTLNWVLVTGTFVANGTESNLVIGNFRTNSATNTVSINPSGASINCDLVIDEVSCIPLNLPAYAFSTNSAYAIPGNTLYLGRQRDVGIDEACIWYKLPNTTNAIDTAAGTTITVAATTETFMVKQDICGVIKYDTAVVHPSGAGFSETSFANRKSYLYPNPNNGQLSVILAKSEPNIQISVVDLTGKIVHEEKKIQTHQPLNLSLNLEQGTYFLQIKFNDGTQDIHRLIVH